MMSVPSSKAIQVTETNCLTITGLAQAPRLRAAICRALTVPNPRYREAVKYNRFLGNLEEFLTYCRVTNTGGLVVPRGALALVRQAAARHGVAVEYIDGTYLAAPVHFPGADITLSDAQEKAVEQALEHSKGLIVGPPGSGKTNMGLAVILRRQQPALWLVHTRELAQQAKERAAQLLGLDPQEIGQFGDGQRWIGKRLTVALVQTLARGVPAEIIAAVGTVVTDESHHAPAEQTAKVVSQFPARYLLGLTATPYRRDGLDAVIRFYLGPVTAQLTEDDLAERLIAPRVFKRDTQITPSGDTFVELVSWLCESPRRNRLIAGDVVRAAQKGRVCLVLTDRVDHAETLGAMIDAQGIRVVVLHGTVPRSEREQVRARIESGELQAVVATGQLIGEGFDAPRLDTLFLATPFSYHGRLVQYVGRVCRTAPGKRDAIVMDYCDDHRMLWASWKRRRAAYEEAAYAITWAPAPTAEEERLLALGRPA